MQENKPQEFEINFEQINIKRLYSLMVRNFWLLLLALALGSVAAFIYTYTRPPLYQAKTQVMVTRPSSSAVTDVTQYLNTQQLTQTYVELLSQSWVRELVSERIGDEIGSVRVLAPENTQIVTILVEHENPERAALSADTLVQVLLEQNENIQSGRYADAEASLDLQISQMETQISDAQAELDEAYVNAFGEEILATQQKIQNSQESVASVEGEISRLDALHNTLGAQATLRERQNSLAEKQLQLEEAEAKLSDVEILLGADPESDELQSQKTILELNINTLTPAISALENEIVWITPLTEGDNFDQLLEEKNTELQVQQDLLDSYKQTYSKLLASGEVEGKTNEIDRMEQNLSLYEQIYINLLKSKETIQLERMQNMPNIVQVTPAASTKVGSRLVLNTVLGGMVFLLLTMGIILVRDFLDTTLKTREDVERNLGIAVVGNIYQFKEGANDQEGPLVIHMPRSPIAESFRSLRTNLEFMGIDSPLKSILISSPGMSEGKTTIAANLGAIIAQSGKRVVLVDADLRRPRLHLEMSVPNRIGLSDIFREKATISQVVQKMDTLDLFVIPSGDKPPNPAELLGSEKMGRILQNLEDEFDLVIIDSTPTVVTDSQLVSARVDGVLIVLWPGRTDVDAARVTVEQYRRVGARLLGVVMNNIQPSRGYGYGYGGYTSYGYLADPDDDAALSTTDKKLTLPPLPWAREKKTSEKTPSSSSKGKKNRSLLYFGSAMLLLAAAWAGFTFLMPAAPELAAEPTATLAEVMDASDLIPTPTVFVAPTATMVEESVETTAALPTATPEPISTIPPVMPREYTIGDSWFRATDGMTMMYIPPGEFMMGSDTGEENEAPAHMIYLDGYWMDQTLVTNDMYYGCMNAGYCDEPTTGYYAYSSFADYPVVFISWENAQNYCEWTGSRLPTEAEWEKAARGTDARLYPWGEGFDCSLANYDTCIGSTTIVGRYENGRSPYGIYDMAGNVWEWIADWYDPAYYTLSPPAQPLGPDTGEYRVLRGSAFGFVNYTIRSSYRNKTTPTNTRNNIGFRCVRSSIDGY